MTRTKYNILVVDDEESMRKTYKAVLKPYYQTFLASSAQEALEVLKNHSISLALLDVMMPEMNGIDLLAEIKSIDQDLEVIMITAVKDIKSAVSAIKLGANNYLTKPFEIEELLSVVEKALEKRALARENRYLKQVLIEQEEHQALLGASPGMTEVKKLIDKVAATDSNVLITGASGTGKELVAHALHRQSARKPNPLVIVNCAAIPENLIEAELFGYERGAFTGALEKKEGKFEVADGGTLFLDEIGCLKPELQSKLLRVLEDGKVERLGATAPTTVDVRIIAATNLDLLAAINKGDFRPDLYYRLNVLRIHLPPLCERKEDIPQLLDYFLAKFNRKLNKKVKAFSHEAVELLMGYEWPGNVRELQNLVERAVALSEVEATISSDSIPLENTAKNIIKKSLKEAEEDFARRYIRNALLEAKNNQTRAAEMLRINRTTLIARLRHLGIEKS